MLAISIKEDRIGFLSAFFSKGDYVINDFGILNLKSKEFTHEVIEKILSRKKIKNSNIVSNKCVISIGIDNVYLNQILSSDKVESDTIVNWINNLIFGGTHSSMYNDYHYEMFENNGMLSIYMEKSKQLDYFSHCKKSKLVLSSLSLDILSADYIARKMFDAEEIGEYVIWAIGKQKDDMLIIKNNSLAGLVSFKRSKNGFEILKKTGSQKLIIQILEKMNSKNFMDFESADFTKKIFIYEKCYTSSNLKKILKKNKDSITVLNPLMKIDSYKKKRNDEIGLSFLSEMGYIFKIIKERTSTV
tara:strand:- start:2862 stop:3767 length:906 start_codon:yes stop_codon:yes gene_type:complete